MPQSSTAQFECFSRQRWKKPLNHPRLIIQPLLYFNWLKRWLAVFPIASLEAGFEQLTHTRDPFICPLVHQLNLQFIFSSAQSGKRGMYASDGAELVIILLRGKK